MKRLNFNNILILSFFIIAFTSCSAPKQITQVSYSNIEKNNSASKSENVYWFRSSDSLDFLYEKVGVIGVIPGDAISQSEIETLVKLEAWKNFANGVVEVTPKSFPQGDSENKIKEKQSQSKPQYNYLAIKFREDSTFFARNSRRTDTTFVSKGIDLQSKLHEPEPSGFEKFMTKMGKIILSLALSSLISWFTLWVMYNPHF